MAPLQIGFVAEPGAIGKGKSVRRPRNAADSRGSRRVTKLLALDQGTSSTRAILFDEHLSVLAVEQQEFPQHYPKPGWVEHDPEDLWSSTQGVIVRVLAKSGTLTGDIAALGITNQRESAIVWDRATGKAIHNAIVWQDRRTADECARLI